MSEFLVSPLIRNQLPEFVREEHSNFILFIEKYYEWLEQSGSLFYEIESFDKSKDVDLATDYYLELIKQELAPYFPEEILVEKSTFIKLLNQFYNAKGTPNSLKFLFRVLYNENIEIYYPKEDILKASDGKWTLPLALRVDTDDDNIFNIVGSVITGQTSTSTAIVEKVSRSIDRQLGIEYIELYISNINRLFVTGETIEASYLSNGNTITVTARLIGALSEIKIDPNYRGLFYNGYDVTTGYEGDPVSIIGGLSSTEGSAPIGAIAKVGETTKGSITDISLIDGGFGFRDPITEPGTTIIDFVGGFQNSILGAEAKASVSLVDTTRRRLVNVSNEYIDSFYSLTLDELSNTNIDVANSVYSSNIENCVIDLLSTQQSLNVYPISFISIDGSGGGYKNLPIVNYYSNYLEELDDIVIITSCAIFKDNNFVTDTSQDLRLSFESGDYVKLFVRNKYEEIRKVFSVSEHVLTFEGAAFENDITDVTVYKVLKRNLSDIGALGKINIIEGGDGYQVGEYLIFTGGSGYGANAEITEVHSGNSGIKTIQFNDVENYVKGGEAYRNDKLPTVTIDTVSGANAVLQVSEVLGTGIDADIFTSRIGAISTLRVLSYGYDYTEAPTISLRNADLVLSNVTEGRLFVSNTNIYQGNSNTDFSFRATVDSFNNDTNLLRVFNYRGELDSTIEIFSDDGIVTANVSSFVFYGDGKARATANFENGLIRYPGVYLNTDGQPSSDKKLQDGKKYHNFSYIISTQNDYVKFKKSVKEVVHPLGTKIFVQRTQDNIDDIANLNIVLENTTENTLANTFNISNGSNNMVATGLSPDLSSVNVGDVLILTNLLKPIEGTVNVSSSSNVVVGTDTNFINDLYDGALIYISSGNTENVIVTNSSILITENVINLTSTDETINLVFNDYKVVTFANSDMILVDTPFTTTSEYVTTIIRKVE
jgi:hypothetical protein